MFPLRTFLVIFLTSLTYGSLLYVLFVDYAILLSVGLLFLLFILFHFFLLEIKDKFARWWYAIVFVCIGLLLGIFGWRKNIFIFTAFVFLHSGLLSIYRTCIDEIINKKIFSAWSLSLTGGYIFTVWITLLYAALFLGLYTSFPLTCNQLYHTLDTITFKNIRSQVDKNGSLENTRTTIKKTIIQTRSLSVGDFLGINFPMPHGSTDAPKNNTENYLSKNNSINQTQNTSGNTKSNQQTINVFSGKTKILPLGKETVIFSGGFLGYIETFKYRRIDQALKDNRLINQNVCETLVKEIQKRFSQPAFQLSSLVLIFLVLSPFMRIFVYLVQVILYILLKIFFLIGFYRIVRTLQEVDHIT